MVNECTFCDHSIFEDRIIASDTLVWATPSNMPIVPGHVLVLPHRHVERFDDLTDEERNALLVLVSKVKKSLRNSFAARGFNLAWNEGELAGQSVPHLHLHVVPRSSGDAGVLTYEPRKFLYRPGSRDISEENELKEVAAVITKSLGT